MASPVEAVASQAVTLGELGGWPAVLSSLLRGEHLSADTAAAALAEILAGDASPAQIAAFCVALRAKGETVEEMAGMRRAMLEQAATVSLPTDQTVVDTCGTGGDRSCSLNVSTLSAIVVAAAGATVCKHGNRAASSACGSADVLEALGVAIDLDGTGVATCIAEVGIGFCLAPRFHPAMRHAGPTRRELGVPTVFNFQGPLANPAHPRRQVVGVSDPSMAETMLGVLASSGTERAFVVWGHDGLDELSTTTTSTMLCLADGEIDRVDIDPAALGLPAATLDDLRGADAATNAGLGRRVLEGTRGPHRDIVLLNAGAAAVVAGLAGGLEEGIAVAAAAIDEGAAAGVLDRWVKVSQACAAAVPAG